jgi:hypothetical protein
MKRYEGVEVQLHEFSTWALDGDGQLGPRPTALPLGNKHLLPLDGRLGGEEKIFVPVWKRTPLF